MTNDLEPDERTPDYRLGNWLLFASQYYDLSLRAGLDAEAKRALSKLAHEGYRALEVRGAVFGELVQAVKSVRGDRRATEEMSVVDFRVSTVATWVARRHDQLRKCGLSFEVFDRFRRLTDAIHDAIVLRGGTVDQVHAALCSVRKDGSILADLPSIRAKLRERGE